MVEVGDKVRIGGSGSSIFIVREVDPEEGRAVIESDIEDAPGRYPFSLPLAALVAAETQE